MSEEDTLECLEYAIESRIKTVKKPKDVFDAKALVALYDFSKCTVSSEFSFVADIMVSMFSKLAV
jgi:hypothetical protein